MADNLHADQTRETFVHRIHGDCRRLQSINLFIGRQARARRKAAHRVEVGFLFVLQDLLGLLKKFFGHFRSFAASFVFSHGVERRDTRGLRIRIFDIACHSRSTEDNDKAMLLHRLYKNLNIWNLDLTK